MSISTHYNYQELDRLLQDEFAPLHLGDNLDEIMNKLISCARSDYDYLGEQLEWHYYILRTLRDIFWELKKS